LERRSRKGGATGSGLEGEVPKERPQRKAAQEAAEAWRRVQRPPEADEGKRAGYTRELVVAAKSRSTVGEIPEVGTRYFLHGSLSMVR
jgi:hypothetical protein